jgi:chemotaxis protein CheD
MSHEKLLVEPGYIYLPYQPTLLYAIVGSGIVITVYDKNMKLGGMSYFFRPIRESDKHHSTPHFAGPSIIGLLNLFDEIGSIKEDLEANVYGGAENAKIEGYIPAIGEQNVQSATYILTQKGIQIIALDTGSDKGRVVIFNSGTGEVILAKIDNITPEDWYPKMEN